MFTMTAIPSFAIVTSFTPSAVSVSFNALEAIPMSHVPSIAEETPVEESFVLISIVTFVFIAA